MNLNIRVFLCVLLAVAGEAGACVGSAVALNPLNSTRLPLAGNGAISFAVELSLDCAAGESFSITPAAATFTTSVGSSAYSLQGVFYADAALTQALHSNPINHTMGAGGTVVTPVYGVLQGESGLFQGMGPYSLEMPLLVTSSAGSPLTLTHLESGNVQGTCSISNATVDFGIVSNTANPVHVATLSLNCTQGLSWSLSRSALAIRVTTQAGSTPTPMPPRHSFPCPSFQAAREWCKMSTCLSDFPAAPKGVASAALALYRA